MVEEHAGRAVHLGDDDALGAVGNEGALLGHERDVAHVDVLLLDVLDGPGAGFLVGFEHDQTKLYLQRSGEGHVALDALLDVVLGLLELVGDVLQDRAFIEVLDRKDRPEDRFNALIPALAHRGLTLQELLIGGTLDLDEVRHLDGFGDAAKGLADPLLAGEGLSHCLPLNRAREVPVRWNTFPGVHPRTSGLPETGRWKPPFRRGRSLARREGEMPCLGT